MRQLFDNDASGQTSGNPNDIGGRDEAGAPGAREIVGLAVAANLWQTLDYAWPAEFGRPQLGQRVRAPLGKGNRKVLAFVAELNPQSAIRNPQSLKSVAELVDAASQFDVTLWKLAQWISSYYLTPLGMVLAAMIPSAVGRRQAMVEQVAYLAKDRHDWPKAIGPRQKKVLDELLEARKQGFEPLELESLMHHSGSSRQSVNRLAQRELLRIESRPVRLPDITGQTAEDTLDLTPEQAVALEALEPKLMGSAVSSDAGPANGTAPCEQAASVAATAPDMGGTPMLLTGKMPVLRADETAARRADDPFATPPGFSATLLYGVTGSGKTEVYVRAIRKVNAAGRQAMLLVPEIALATQTLSRLLSRLGRVAVLHSGLTDVQRAFYYEQIREGHAAVIVGPRSAVFAPARNLGLIIVDEEHEPSYKQDNAPRYHGRDVAVMRANLAQIPVVLGSATPSLETMHNVQQGRYAMLRLPARVRGLPMPKLQIVNLRKEIQPGRIELMGRTLTLKLAQVLDRRQQAILLMNRRGYASYIFCPSGHWMYQCDHCTRPMVFHQATQLVMCHYCQHTAALPEYCPVCRGKILLFGLGIQRIEGELARKFPLARVARMDSDTMTSAAQFKRVLDEFGAGQIDILLGTQMVAKGLDFPRVSLVGVISADTSLTIPDFRASERTFQLIVQVAGRAGRSDIPGEVIVQTLYEDEPAIQFAVKHDYDGFAAKELPLRQDAHLPPYWRLVRFVIRHADASKGQEAATQLAARLRSALPAEVVILGPSPAGIFKIKNQFRFQVLLMSPKAGLVQQYMHNRLVTCLKGLSADIIADADPMTLS
jgi:primosomal protein N' (replication factor Y)